MPTARPTAMTTPPVRAVDHLWSASAASVGSQAWVRMSHRRKTSTPMAMPLRAALRRGAGWRSRPMGRPRKIVNPAIAPRRAIWLPDMETELRRTRDTHRDLGEPHQGKPHHAVMANRPQQARDLPGAPDDGASLTLRRPDPGRPLGRGPAPLVRGPPRAAA